MFRLFGHVILGLAAVSLAGAAVADGYRSHTSREYVRQAPVKDCTRLNGRYGYYGNPWCTPAEQARWDARSARRYWAN
jgi:hypothetical protein